MYSRTLKFALVYPDILYNNLKENQFDFTATMSNNEQVKLNVPNAEEHRRLTNFLTGRYISGIPTRISRQDPSGLLQKSYTIHARNDR